jgi:hypothetical protein
MSEAEYTRVTYDVAVAAGKMLLAQNPRLTFVFVSGMGTDSTETGKTMWARVKGRTENALLSMPFKASYMVRPAVVQPLHGERSRATLSRAGYVVMAPFLSLLKAVAPKYVTTSERIGRAMIQLAKHGGPKRVLESADIDVLGREAALEPS